MKLREDYTKGLYRPRLLCTWCHNQIIQDLNECTKGYRNRIKLPAGGCQNLNQAHDKSQLETCYTHFYRIGFNYKLNSKY